MIFDSKDPDRMDRASQPIYIQNDELCRNHDGERVCFNNRLNAYMDHCWDGFYTCQKREQRFPSLVDTRADGYTIEYTGTPPSKQEFRLYANSGAAGFLATIYYPNAGAYYVYDENMHLVDPTDWDHAAQTWAKPTGQKGCGENRYEGVINRLQFWIEPGCRLHIIPRDAIMLGIRMEFTVDEFFANGGVVTFADRMAAVLGIHAADIKVVSVYEGSTIVEFFIQQVLPEEAQLDLSAIGDTYKEVVSTMGEFMGSPILNAMENGHAIATKFSDDEDFHGFEENLWSGLIPDDDKRPPSKRGDDDEPVVVDETNVNIDVVYRTADNSSLTKSKEQGGDAAMKTYIILLLAIIAVLIFVMLAVCCYNRVAMKI